jgi:signal transduction histidine kinase
MEMIEAASEQLAELLDELGLAARIEGGRYDPGLRDVETMELAREAAERLGEDRVSISGEGTTVQTDAEAMPRAVSALVQATLRHGGLERVALAVAGAELIVSPVTPASAPVVLGEDLRDLGAAVGVRLVRALGGSVELDGESLRIRLAQ